MRSASPEEGASKLLAAYWLLLHLHMPAVVVALAGLFTGVPFLLQAVGASAWFG